MKLKNDLSQYMKSVKCEHDDNIRGYKIQYLVFMGLPFILLAAGLITGVILVINSNLKFELKMLWLLLTVLISIVGSFFISCLQVVVRLLIFHIERINYNTDKLCRFFEIEKEQGQSINKDNKEETGNISSDIEIKASEPQIIIEQNVIEESNNSINKDMNINELQNEKLNCNVENIKIKEKKYESIINLSYDELLEGNDGYIKTVPFSVTNKNYNWNNHVRGELVSINVDCDSVLAGSLGRVLGVTKDKEIDVQFIVNGEALIIRCNNDEIDVVKQNFTNVGPDDKCPCGSGKKFKLCHGLGNRLKK